MRRRPNVIQYIRYCYGRRLPDTIRDWVRNDWPARAQPPG
jgi:hypothetical protein